MKIKFLLASVLLSLTFGSAIAEETTETSAVTEASKGYNKTFNPRQIEYPNYLGFNDLHLEAIRHLKPDTNSAHDPKLQIPVHHHCKGYDDGTFVCLMFHTGMGDQDKPIGFEYIITVEQYNELPEKEKKYWHYHKTEFPRAEVGLPDLTKKEAEKLLPILNETYGKVIYIQNPDDKFPMGEPYVLVIQDLPVISEQD
ncbi:Protein of unknown function [Nitrosomonas aestuarii]|uniref:DUF1264 domain-containing protein n=1 Tax=Nitrosomonas aestuarii TaxID=52441 RepID=A0A1I4HRB7_9PROT|nr:DUF1264 domain-containing protein [Nitrosomonas aestuarii]SFL44614.1 Protein of unknown function [Nitrosomonas aestuarii]HNP97336.1 DUF1264 domain-containing protein [Cyclobacteriaceae bacterium]